MKHGAQWLIATLIFVAAMTAGVTASRSKKDPQPNVASAPVSRQGDAPQAPSCPPPRRGVWTGGTPHAREVALTFDDGPSDQTETILRALRRHDAHATFFLVGQQIPGREGVLRQAVHQGNELGNHSTSHTALPGRHDISETSRLIRRATGTRPCLFRPPNGDTSDELLRNVRRLGMTTIAWDVDTGDWADQSPADIRARVMATVHPGSIILLHDGGGDRSGTARAASALIDDLHARDYRIVTVSRLFADARQDRDRRGS